MKSKINVTKITDDIWQFNEANSSGPYVDAYLICGTDRAIVVDSLQTLPDLYDQVRHITELPIDVIITHGHGDHAGESLKGFVDAGCKVYMDMKDYAHLLDFGPTGVDEKWFNDCCDGMKFDLEKYCFTVISVPGHSAGSLVILDEKNKLMFSGDTIGSGAFWMQIPTALPIARFNLSLEKLYSMTKNIHGLFIYPGHRNQSAVQLNEQYVKDVRTITKGIMSGTMVGKHSILDFNGRHMEYNEISYGLMNSYCYNPNAVFMDAPETDLGKIRSKFCKREMRANTTILDYMFFVPQTKENEKYPLVIYLHGAGERGCGNTEIVLANTGPTEFASDSWQYSHPCYIVAPQCPLNSSWNNEDYLSVIVSAVSELTKEFPIDSCRIYVTGLSMGGMGTWKMLSMFPTFIAAAMPICGGGDPFEIRKAKNVPIWAFHAEDDEIVPVTGKFTGLLNGETVYATRQMVSSLRSCGAKDVRYTEYPAGYMQKVVHTATHCSWIPAYENSDAKEWMFSQTRYDKYEIDLIVPGVWHIEDFNNDSIYLIEGKEKALLIDTGLGGGNFLNIISSLTALPIELAITHAHGDHMLHSDKFNKFYMSKKEEAVLPIFINTMMPENKSTIDNAIDIKSGDLIDLGGGIEIEVYELIGHTPGSVVFIDKAHKLCFTGDALGVWMQVPGATSISTYRENLIRFNERLSQGDLENIGFLGGHCRQEGGSYPFGMDYKPNSPEKVRDMIILCDKILNDEAEVTAYPFSFDEPALAAEFGTAVMIFKSSVKK